MHEFISVSCPDNCLIEQLPTMSLLCWTEHFDHSLVLCQNTSVRVTTLCKDIIWLMLIFRGDLQSLVAGIVPLEQLMV